MSATLIKVPMFPTSEELLADLYRAKLMVDVIPIGSYHAFGEGHDKDYVLLVKEFLPLDDVVDCLDEQGYTVSSPDRGEDGYGESDVFIAMRKGELNVLVTDDYGFAERSRAAFDVVRVLRLHDKQDRIAVHKVVVDGARV